MTAYVYVYIRAVCTVCLHRYVRMCVCINKICLHDVYIHTVCTVCTTYILYMYI